MRLTTQLGHQDRPVCAVHCRPDGHHELLQSTAVVVPCREERCVSLAHGVVLLYVQISRSAPQDTCCHAARRRVTSPDALVTTSENRADVQPPRACSTDGSRGSLLSKLSPIPRKPPFPAPTRLSPRQPSQLQSGHVLPSDALGHCSPPPPLLTPSPARSASRPPRPTPTDTQRIHLDPSRFACRRISNRRILAHRHMGNGCHERPPRRLGPSDPGTLLRGFLARAHFAGRVLYRSAVLPRQDFYGGL